MPSPLPRFFSFIRSPVEGGSAPHYRFSTSIHTPAKKSDLIVAVFLLDIYRVASESAPCKQFSWTRGQYIRLGPHFSLLPPFPAAPPRSCHRTLRPASSPRSFIPTSPCLLSSSSHSISAPFCGHLRRPLPRAHSLAHHIASIALHPEDLRPPTPRLVQTYSAASSTECDRATCRQSCHELCLGTLLDTSQSLPPISNPSKSFPRLRWSETNPVQKSCVLLGVGPKWTGWTGWKGLGRSRVAMDYFLFLTCSLLY